MATETTATATTAKIDAQDTTELITVTIESAAKGEARDNKGEARDKSENRDTTVATALTEEQQKMLHFVYDSAKGLASEVLSRPSLPAALQITQLMAGIMKQMESLEFGGSKLTGATKKAVAIELGRTLIKDLIRDDTVKAVILPLYDTMADSLLETMIDVSQHVNIAVKDAKNAIAGCCEWMSACLRK